MVSSTLLECLLHNTTTVTAPWLLEYHVTVESFLGPSMLDGPYPEFGVNIVDGVVWFWLLEQWQDLPNKLWAWKSVTVWTEGHYYYGSRIWVPSLLLFDFWEYDRSSYSPVAVSVINYFPRAPGPAAAAVIAPRLFELLRRSSESELCRTCRLVCRDWANACPLRDRERCNLSFKGGSVWYRIEEEWRYLPSEYWAWTPRYEEWWVDCCPGQWSLKLVRPIDDTVQRNPKYTSVPPLPLSPDNTSTRSGSSTVAALPPELLQYICDAADPESSSSRLVCRHWNRLCTPRVFERVDVKESPELIRALWRHRTDRVMGHVKVVEDVPQYEDSKFPWVHLLTQACASTRSVWMTEWGDQGKLYIIGPFAGGHQTIRSVHFALPRSLPRSFSRSIKSLAMYDIDFSKIEDLTHLVCELPDLETLFCGTDTTINPDSLPIQLPRRRPRTNRNRLREVGLDIRTKGQDDLLEMVLTVYLSVYDAMSFFSDGEIPIILALLKPRYRLRVVGAKFCYEESIHNHSRRLCEFFALQLVYRIVLIEFITGFIRVLPPDTTTDDHKNLLSWSLRILRDLQRKHTILDCAIGCWSTDVKDLDCWTQLDTEFDKIQGLIWQASFVFGFQDRKDMIEFATNILEKKMPSISKFTTVQYSIQIKAETSSGLGQWYQASLDSEELTGTPKKYLWEVYS